LPCLRPPVCVSTPSDVSAAFGHRQSSTGRSRSVLVVLHDLDGLLHTPASVRLSESSDRSPRLEGLAPVGAPRRSGCLPPPNQQAGSWVSDLGSPVAGLLHPAAEQGLLRFSWLAPPSEEGGCSRAGTSSGRVPRCVDQPRVSPPRAASTLRRVVCPVSCADPRPFPQHGSHPSKKPPRQQPHPVTRTVALLPLCLHPFPAQKLGSRWRPSTSGPCSAVGSVARPTVAGDHAPSPSMGLVPLQGSGSDASSRSRPTTGVSTGRPVNVAADPTAAAESSSQLPARVPGVIPAAG